RDPATRQRRRPAGAAQRARPRRVERTLRRAGRVPLGRAEGGRMSHLWSGRFAGEPDRDVFDFGKSLPVDRRLIEDDLTGSQAWAEALANAGVLSADEGRKIVDGLEAIRAAVHADASLLANAADEDVHAFVERELVSRIG